MADDTVARATSDGGQMNVLNLLRSGLDTHDIAKRMKLDEAVIYNMIHRMREAEKGIPPKVSMRGKVKYAGCDR